MFELFFQNDPPDTLGDNESQGSEYLKWFYSLPPEEREAIKYIFGNRE